jgi:hypothetical protein
MPNIVEPQRRWYTSPLVYLAALAAAATAFGGLRATGVIGRSYDLPNPSIDKPSINRPAERPAPTSYWESSDNLARIEFPGLTEEDAKPFIDAAYNKAQAEGKRFDGIVAGGRMQRVKTVAYGQVRVEQDCGPSIALKCDEATLSKIAAQSEEARKFIMDTLKPTKEKGIYVTVSADGQRANVTYFDEDRYPNHVNMLRDSATKFYPWHVEDDWDQMTWESAVRIAQGLEYTSEGFLDDFWGATMTQIKGGLKGGSYTGGYSVNRSVSGLAANISNALVKEGFDAPKFTQLAQRLEGTNARWEQFKAEAGAVAGRHLPTLDLLDNEVKLYRIHETSSVINDRSVALARILEENPGLNTPAYIRTYYEQFA